MNIPAITDQDVLETFNRFPDSLRALAYSVRDIIYRQAAQSPEIGEIVETLKWGVPSYLTVAPKSGTTVRLAEPRAFPGQLAVSVHCQTTLIDSFRQLYPELEYEKNRSIILPSSESGKPLPMAELEHFIYLALTYHR